jgi:hypothetical protein
MSGYVFPLALNGFPQEEGFDIGGREARVLEADHIEGLVTVLALAAEGDSVKRVRMKNAARTGELRAWLEPVAGGDVLLHVETPYGDRAVLGPIHLDRDGFAKAGDETYFDGAQGRWRLGFAKPYPLTREAGTESFGPQTFPPKPLVPALVEILVERPEQEPQYFEHTVNAGTDAERQALINAAARYAAGESATGRIPRHRTSFNNTNHQFQVVAVVENEPGQWVGKATFTMPQVLREVTA